MNSCDKQQLKTTAAKVRLGIIEGVYNTKSGHPGGSLSAADIFTYLYFKELHIDPQNPKDPDRDRFVLSKGHCAPGLYAALARSPATSFRMARCFPKRTAWRLQSRAASAAWRLRAATAVNICAAYRTARRATI